jgi:predicted chitinase
MASFLAYIKEEKKIKNCQKEVLSYSAQKKASKKSENYTKLYKARTFWRIL